MKLNKNLYRPILIVMLAFFACNNDPPCDPCDSCCPACPACDSCCPACPECLECPPDYELVKEPLVWHCEPIDPGPQPEDYYTLRHAGTYADGWEFCHEHTGMVEDICQDLCPWACWRDPQYVARFCSWGCAGGSDPMFDLTASEMHEFGELGAELHDSGLRWMTRLPDVNRRCDPTHPQHDPRFCGRSAVRKTTYPDGTKPPFKTWEDAFDAHKTRALAFADLAQTDPVRQICEYDSIKGWCQCRNDHSGPRK